MNINTERLKGNLLQLSRIGADPDGRGVNRFAYSKEYDEGAAFVSSLMEDAGLTVEMDPIGNLFGTKQGKSDRVILLGSHIDTVPHAGIFDGCLGVLGAIEVMKTLQENGIELEHTVRIAAWADEEGNEVLGVIGSSSFTGLLTDLSDYNKQKLARVDRTVDDMIASQCTYLDKIDASLELHIEQGGIMEAEGKQIGVVTGIFGTNRYETTIYGDSNHAGSTPMRLRDDAMVKAAHLICELDDYVRRLDPDMVCTVGWLRAKPGANNIIAGEVTFMVEVRGMNNDRLWDVKDFILRRFPEGEVRAEIPFIQPPAPMSQLCRQVVAEAADELGLSHMEIGSGAGHDSLCLSRVIPNTGMIFVPSIGGRSHCPEERTGWEDCANGVNVLLLSVLKLDQMKKAL